jgi:hypothetical protein
MRTIGGGGCGWKLLGYMPPELGAVPEAAVPAAARLLSEISRIFLFSLFSALVVSTPCTSRRWATALVLVKLQIDKTDESHKNRILNNVNTVSMESVPLDRNARAVTRAVRITETVPSGLR